ncbi:MAG: carbamoyl-phosphate synthase large subunit [Clostridia bacterium]|nr:carbamoyl-phosphate synthase large subunit [Clostridia bacterium]
MPRNRNIKKVLVIGSGPIVIGQAAEFDYAGTQACRELKKEGVEVVLVNSNPATIMTDKNMADKIYIEPLTVETIKNIIRKERPDSILPNLGGQTGLNLAMELEECGFLKEYKVNLLGTGVDGIRNAEDRQCFKDMMESIGEPCVASKVVHTVGDALDFGKEIGLPVIVRPAYTLGGTGGGIAYTLSELEEIAGSGIRLSRVSEILVEKCISGWKEIEYEVIRDKNDTCITVCNMENIDPVGIHTGDSIVVAPSQTLADKEYQMLRTSAIKIISALKIEGGCNVQFALDPNSFRYAVIEVNPRVSRSSALASKATGYPIAKVATKIALGYTLDEIRNEVTGKTYACFEPVLDYVVVKIPKWPFKKFLTASRILGTQMKATGEVMAIAPSMEMAIMKAVRSLEENVDYLYLDKLKDFEKYEIEEQLAVQDNERIFVIAEAIRKEISVERIHEITNIDKYFLGIIYKIVKIENVLEFSKLTPDIIRRAKEMGFTDKVIAKISGKEIKDIRRIREKYNIFANFKMVDTCSAEFEARTPYYYSSYDEDNEIKESNKKKVMVLGSGPIRIGQGIEFDYCSVHGVWALKKKGYETIIVNNNPETVSTDFDIADRLYFEPLTPEDVENIVNIEKPEGAIVQFGGQTAIKLTKALSDMGVHIMGTSEVDMDRAEDRKEFDDALSNCGILRPKGETVFTTEEAIDVANKLRYPVLVRPSYVLGGQGMAIAYDDKEIAEYVSEINQIAQEHPILVDKYVVGREVEVDAICDGEDVLIPGVMEHLERAGIHSGDSISVYPTQNVEKVHERIIVDYTTKLAKELNIIGMLNIQFIISEGLVYVIEVNPRSSRTVPYISKVTNLPMIDIATRVITGEKLKDMGYGTGLYKKSDYVCVKMPVFSFEKIKNADTSLGPEMKSTGEVLGVDREFKNAILKAFIASGTNVSKTGGILITVRDKDKEEMLPLARNFKRLGFKIYATTGTAMFLGKHSVEANVIEKLWEGKNSIIDLIEEGKINFVINTPTKGKQANRDGFKIRRMAVECKIPCFTSLDTVKALYDAIESETDDKDLIPVDITRIGY